MATAEGWAAQLALLRCFVALGLGAVMCGGSEMGPTGFRPSPPKRRDIFVPDGFPTINAAYKEAGSPDVPSLLHCDADCLCARSRRLFALTRLLQVLTIRSGHHQIGEHSIPAGLFHNNEASHFEAELEVNKKLLLQGDPSGIAKPEMSGMLILQQPVDVDTWKEDEGGGAVRFLNFRHRDLESDGSLGYHGFCLAVEGGTWLVEECEIRNCGHYSKAVWCYGGQYVFDDSWRGGGRIVDHFPGPEATLRRCTFGGMMDGNEQGQAGWGILTWHLARVCVEDCLIEDVAFIGASCCHASELSLFGCTVQGCAVGALLVDEEGKLTVRSCLIKDNKSAFVAGRESYDATMELYDNVVHGRAWHDDWGGEVHEADTYEYIGDDNPLFLGTWTDRGRIPDLDPDDVQRYVRRVRSNTWSRKPVRISPQDCESMGVDPPKKVVSRIVGRPGFVHEENAAFEDSPTLAPLVGIGIQLNFTDKGEVVVIGLLVGMPAQVGGVEVGDVITSVDGAPVWLPEEVARRCAGEPGSTVTLGLLRGPYRGEMEITLQRRLIGLVPQEAARGAVIAGVRGARKCIREGDGGGRDEKAEGSGERGAGGTGDGGT